MTVYVNVYPSGSPKRYIYSSAHHSREEADMWANERRMYCIKVTMK